MGYLHINNLYRAKDILLFRECYALEKVHGSSAHISWNEGTLGFFSGGESHERFMALFDHEKLKAGFEKLGQPKVVIFGEVYGGKCQGMKETYGQDLRFIAFDVQINESWLDVPNMDQVSTNLGLEVVPWAKVSTDLSVLDAERDKPSEVAVRRGINDKMREGVVIRPLIELTTNNGERVIVKHKGEKFSERATPQKIISSDKAIVLAEAEAIANEWVVPHRLEHVVSKLELNEQKLDMPDIPKIIAAMIEDVFREAAGEIVESKEAKAAIGKKTAQMFKKYLVERIGK